MNRDSAREVPDVPSVAQIRSPGKRAARRDHDLANSMEWRAIRDDIIGESHRRGPPHWSVS
jgi:hypothetical protein